MGDAHSGNAVSNNSKTAGQRCGSLGRFFGESRGRRAAASVKKPWPTASCVRRNITPSPRSTRPGSRAAAAASAAEAPPKQCQRRALRPSGPPASYPSRKTASAAAAARPRSSEREQMRATRTTWSSAAEVAAALAAPAGPVAPTAPSPSAAPSPTAPPLTPAPMPPSPPPCRRGVRGEVGAVPSSTRRWPPSRAGSPMY
mmetsp:Transcript_101365/g.326727  ORF Transcript_101365/g.326727 Transcript_101365/m.326727 type:complete len:200 (-) Transcript_101365:586-1185(-)